MGLYQDTYGANPPSMPQAVTQPAASVAAPAPQGQTLFSQYMNSTKPGGRGGGYQSASNTTAGSSEPQWSDLPGNILPSAGANISAIAHTIAHPITTAENLYDLGLGGIKDYFVNRYGGYENMKRSIIEDPVGVLLDLSTFISGGGGAAARIPGVAGKVAATAVKAGRYVDPIVGAGKVIGGAAKSTAKGLGYGLGATTNTGDAVRVAAQAGFEGGQAAKDFKANIAPVGAKGSVPPEQLVKESKTALGKAYKDLFKHYGNDLNPLKDVAVPARPAFKQIATAIADATKEYGGYAPKGMAPGPGRATKAITKATDIIKDFAAKDPAYHTVGGFDELKQTLNDLVSKYKKGSVSQGALIKIKNAVTEVVDNIHPGYGKLTKQFAEDKALLQEISKTLSLGPGSTLDAALRKMMTVVRSHTAHANFGARTRLVQVLEDNGAHNLLTKLAGQSLRPGYRPNLVANLLAPGAAIGGAAALGFISPWAGLTLAAFSPRIMGKAAFQSGRIAKLVVHPLISTEKALNKLGIARPAVSAVKQAANKVGVNKITKHGAALAAAQAGKLSNYQTSLPENTKRLSTALMQQAKSMGYNIDSRVLDRLSAKLLSEDKKTYVNGLNMLGNNDRLMSIIKTIGTKGE